MQNLVETRSGEIVEILNGVLYCANTAENWETIGDWMLADSGGMELTIKVVEYRKLSVEMPESVTTSSLESLLEHFEWQ